MVEEVDGFHTGVLLITDLQLVKFAKQIYQSLHHLHAVLAETEESGRQKSVVVSFAFKISGLYDPDETEVLIFEF